MNNNTVELKPSKKGDTPTFLFAFKNPSPDFDWTGITLDCVMTDVQAPTTNTGAAAIRLDRPLEPTSTGAEYPFLLTVEEANKLVVGNTYHIEAQLKQDGTIVVTPVTARIKITQDYIV